MILISGFKGPPLRSKTSVRTYVNRISVSAALELSKSAFKKKKKPFPIYVVTFKFSTIFA